MEADNKEGEVATALCPELLAKYDAEGIDTAVLIELIEHAPVDVREKLIAHLKRGHFFALDDGHPDAALYARLDKKSRAD